MAPEALSEVPPFLYGLLGPWAFIFFRTSKFNPALDKHSHEKASRGDSASTATSPTGGRGAGGLQEQRERCDVLSLGKGWTKDLVLEGE